MANAVVAVGIKELYYGNVIDSATNLTKAGLATLKSTMTKVANVHQDTWALEESEPSQDSYRNQLTQAVYRMGTKQMGEITINFTIGQYDYTLKSELLGGSTITESESVVGWKRGKGIVEVLKAFMAITEDNQVVVFPKTNVLAHESNNDGATGIAMKATVLEPEQAELSSEYWFDDPFTV